VRLPKPVHEVDIIRVGDDPWAEDALQTRHNWWAGGTPGEVLVGFGKQTIWIAPYSMVWSNQVAVPWAMPFARILHSALPEEPEYALETFEYLIKAARTLRLSTYQACSMCKQTKPPEWMHNEEVCQSCAEKHLGVAY